MAGKPAKPGRAVAPAASVPLALPSVLDLKEATVLADALLGRRGTGVDIDAASVQRLGAQCLQVLLAARATWEGDGQDFAIVNPSPALQAGLALAGVAPSALNCSQERAA